MITVNSRVPSKFRQSACYVREYVKPYLKSSAMAGNRRKASVGKSHKSPMLTFITEDCPTSEPATGYRNGTDVNNRGNNGNYWSSSLNSNNSNNAYNLNFNDNNYDWNNNNRYYGQSVRPVSELATPDSSLLKFRISPEQLLVDLYRAYRDARKHKRKRFYQLEFELDLEAELVALRDALVSRTYTPGTSSCFIINDPKQREVFAAEFRDRVVHHLYYNYTYELFERTFISDSYSCRKKKGTHYGFKRLGHHIRSVSQNYTRQCYVMKIDIMGYFMHINRSRLLDISLGTLRKMAMRWSDVPDMRWCEKLDYDLLFFLSRVIIMNNPLDNCIIRGSSADWKGLPRSKSLFYSTKGCGLPIGNLTSQLFSNVYMNVFDNYIKRSIPSIAYGRYVDDAFFVASSKNILRCVVPQISEFLKTNLGLEVHPNKVLIVDAKYGVEFLGGYNKPYRCYIANKSLARLRYKVFALNAVCYARKLQASVNSFLGVLSHYSTYVIKKELFSAVPVLQNYGRLNAGFTKFVLEKQVGNIKKRV